MDENWKNLEDAEDFAYFRAELVEMSPESYSLEEKRQILEDMWKTSSDIENRMREDFAKLDEVSQTSSSTASERRDTATGIGGTACSWTARSAATSRPSRRRRPRIHLRVRGRSCGHL